jgi:hypothetical protein
MQRNRQKNRNKLLIIEIDRSPATHFAIEQAGHADNQGLPQEAIIQGESKLQQQAENCPQPDRLQATEVRDSKPHLHGYHSPVLGGLQKHIPEGEVAEEAAERLSTLEAYYILIFICCQKIFIFSATAEIHAD